MQQTAEMELSETGKDARDCRLVAGAVHIAVLLVSAKRKTSRRS